MGCGEGGGGGEVFLRLGKRETFHLLINYERKPAVISSRDHERPRETRGRESIGFAPTRPPPTEKPPCFVGGEGGFVSDEGMAKAN